MRLIDRYVLRLMVMPTLIGVAVFMVIMLSETAIKLGDTVIGLRVPPALIGQYFLFRLPRVFAWSLPVGILVGAAMVTTQMARAGEATAMRAGGASLRRIWVSIVALAMAATVVSFAVEEFLVPAANTRGTRVFNTMTRTQPVMESRSDQVFRDEKGQIIYVGHMDVVSNQLQNVLVVDQRDDGSPKVITAARRAERQGNEWMLREGIRLRLGARGSELGPWEPFEAEAISLWSALDEYYSDQRTDYEMSAREIRERVDLLRSSGQDPQRWEVRLQFRYSMPVACLVFAMVAAPLGMQFAHLGSFVGIVISILVVFLYNGVRSWGLAFGLVGDLNPIVAAWAQNIIFGSLGLWLVLRAR
ncbi:MAG: LptF/LptG family permease [Armatimonadetes bacterium]|jgi:lipopolysaccharide export system permease protein|nr:LptF/LptG family permease [Armatimonadota bacterium]MDI9586111.1 LptF/LptG family permease [Acidobacteriota bacterium]